MISEPRTFMLGVGPRAIEEHAESPKVKKKKRQPSARPPEKSLAEIEANLARFNAWQRGERDAPAFWDVAEHLVRVAK